MLSKDLLGSFELVHRASDLPDEFRLAGPFADHALTSISSGVSLHDSSERSKKCAIKLRILFVISYIVRSFTFNRTFLDVDSLITS